MQGTMLLPLEDPILEKGERTMISRIWHGWTTAGNADAYEALLKEEIFVGIHSRQIRGFKGIQLLRREAGKEIEFVTIMAFDSLDAVREFAGEDYEAAVVPEKARALLSRFDGRSSHYEIRADEGPAADPIPR
jgi:heme-degrading monooxygenase HmoA